MYYLVGVWQISPGDTTHFTVSTGVCMAKWCICHYLPTSPYNVKHDYSDRHPGGWQNGVFGIRGRSQKDETKWCILLVYENGVFGWSMAKWCIWLVTAKWCIWYVVFCSSIRNMLYLVGVWQNGVFEKWCICLQCGKMVVFIKSIPQLRTE